MLSSIENWDGLRVPGEASGQELEYPERLVEPSGWLGHVPFAMWLIGALKPNMVVELGVHTGNSYCAFLQTVSRMDLDTRCFGIDHWRGDEHAGYYGDEIYDELRAYHDPRYGRFSTLIRGAFEETSSNFSDGTIDLLHIDGFHSYEAVSNDFRTWLPKMSSRGVVLFHDTNVRERGFGIWQFWEELAALYPHFEFLHSHGLGVAYVGTEPLVDELEMLFATKTTAEAERVRSYFARLGSSVADRRAVVRLETNLHNARSELARYRIDTDTLVAAHDKAAAGLHAALENVKGLELRLQQELLAAGTEKQMYQRQLDEYQRQLDALVRSRSWQFTAPARNIVTKLRRLLLSNRRSPSGSTPDVPPS